jgi:N-acetylmuramoyl-L-alanine amidase
MPDATCKSPLARLQCGMRFRNLIAAVLAAALAACTHAPEHNPLAQWVPSKNYGPRRAVLIVIHATEQNSVQESLDTLRTANSGGPVSAHYLIGRDGKRYQLVADGERAWHAGPGRWGTIGDLNSASIGIELDNDGLAEFPPEQIDSLLVLLEDLCTRLNITRTDIVAHADFAPTRKRDPGAKFPWKRLAEAGFGRWPATDAGEPPPGFDPWLALRLIGYPLEDRAATVRAFHRHFRARETDVLDAEDLRILYALTRQAE